MTEATNIDMVERRREKSNKVSLYTHKTVSIHFVHVHNYYVINPFVLRQLSTFTTMYFVIKTPSTIPRTPASLIPVMDSERATSTPLLR